ncbi:hypothetical protein QBC43DRAFT_361185 [Cladorrhinum sp. PSN259]|nr:hypothetical protein QBC43DRAFT_361185 [Cladorrhinum sp. PSN259]
MIHTWQRQIESHAVPNELSYSLSPKGCEQWAADIDDGSVIHHRLRSDLEDARDVGAELRQFATLVHSINLTAPQENVPVHLFKRPEQRVRDFLSFVAERVMRDIQNNMGEHVVNSVPVDLAFSYPQWWSETEKCKYYSAIKSAFHPHLCPTIKQIYFVDELRASVSFHLCERILEENEKFLPVSLTETREFGAEYRTGSSLVDQEFLRFVRAQLDSRDIELTRLEDLEAARFRQLLDRFEPIIHSFDGKEHKLPWPIQLPWGLSLRQPGRFPRTFPRTLRITSEDIKSFFETSIANLESLLETQFHHAHVIAKSAPKELFLAGPFVQIPYVYLRIKVWGMQRRVEVYRLESFETSIPRGCIAHALGILGHTPRPVFLVPCHYGIVHCEPFSAGQHNQNDLQVDPGDQTQQAKGQIKWLLEKGQPIFFDQRDSHCVSVELERNFIQNETTSTVVVVICELDARPSRVADLVSGTYETIKLEYLVSDIPASEVQKHKMKRRFLVKSRGHYLHVSLRLQLLAGSDSIKVQLDSGGVLLVEHKITL